MTNQKLKEAAEKLRSQGRGGDSILAHINPREAEILKAHGGSGTINPNTGLLEFLNITENGNIVATGGVLPPDILPAADAARIAARPWGQSSVGGGFFGGFQARGLADAAPIWAAVGIPMVGAAIGAALIESGMMASAASASASATAAGATAAQAAAAGAAATATATAVGTAMANTSYQIAAGVPADKAVINSATNAAIQIGTPAIAGQVQNTILAATKNPIVVNALTTATVSAGQALIQGKNAADAFQQGGQAALVSQITSQMPGFDNLPKAAKTVVTDAIKAKASGKDFKATPDYLWNTVISTANKTANNTQATNNKFNETLSRAATEDELKQFAAVETEEELNSSFSAYMNKLDAETSARQAEIDRITREAADAEAAARQAAIDEQNRLDAAEAERIANDEAERLRLAGLQEKTDVDLNKVVAGGDTTDEDAEQARRVAEFGKDLTGGGVQDSGVSDTKTGFYEPDASSTGAYKYDPTSGTYTYTSDDGSTLTLDADGNIVGSTESTDTSWTGLTDTATGNLKLPKLPGGKLPAVKPPAKKVTTTKPTSTTTGAGNTAITTGSNTAVQTGGGLNVPALLAIMSQFGQQQPQQQQQVQEPGKEFEYFDWSADPFAPKTKDKTNPTGQPKMAGGGSVDELLEILRRSGI